MNNSNSPTLGRGAFNVLMCALVLAAAMIFKGVAFSVDPMAVAKISPIFLLLIAIGGILFGSWLTCKRGSLALQFLGFAIIPSVLGFVSSPWISTINPATAFEAGCLTLLCTFVMMILSGLFPKFFIKIRGVLAIGLLVLIIVGLLGMFVMDINMTIYHFAAILLFLGFLGYDLVIVRQAEPSVSNAIVLSTSMFIDLLNLFMHISAVLED